MCILAWHWQPGASTELLIVANRDEAFARPSQSVHLWPDGRVLAGRDLLAGGTWMGVSRGRHFAALTNYRSATPARTDVASRGTLATDFLLGQETAMDYLRPLAPRSGDFNPFNLLLWDGVSMFGLEGRHGRIVRLQPGWGAVSNADFHTPWPKVERLLAGLQTAVRDGPCDDEALLNLLADDTPAPDTTLPRTGVSLERERALSSVFIRGSHYGTRASSVVRISAHGASFCERIHDPDRSPQTCTSSVVFERD